MDVVELLSGLTGLCTHPCGNHGQPVTLPMLGHNLSNETCQFYLIIIVYIIIAIVLSPAETKKSLYGQLL